MKKLLLTLVLVKLLPIQKKINSAIEDLTQITGQKPMVTQAKKSIAGFKLRKGLNMGCKVTLRKK